MFFKFRQVLDRWKHYLPKWCTRCGKSAENGNAKRELLESEQTVPDADVEMTVIGAIGEQKLNPLSNSSPMSDGGENAVGGKRVGSTGRDSNFHKQISLVDDEDASNQKTTV